ncbi:hypothetical protein QZM18_02370 [Burkholderia diffusa]|uniref:hypothetical protein n=1 Tax=Burkholderia diffusa TaxID=488732 RepID=UPI00264F6A17|nr:hypothetical protein [Burkholderia diffusa]MDN7902968.1 hypothetical protein [Burkholderia diffusa]
MSFATMFVRWLAERLSGHAATAGRLPPAAFAAPRRSLRWRAPWLVWHLLSWVVLTLLAPPIWTIGTLLLIDASCDQPLFWTLAMAIVPVANGAAIVAANQRHHRVPFTRRSTVALYLFFVAMAVGCALFVLLLWRSHAIASLVGPLALTTDGTHPATLAFWVAGLTAMFGVTSFAHASIAHAWLAFVD